MKVLLVLLILHVSLLKGDFVEKDWWQRTVFYQIYPRSFKDSNGDGIGDLNGITQQLHHLKETGIEAVWMSPIFESPMVDFGYDISNYRRIQPEYGTMADFERLISRAQELEIKVILDFVPNHTSDRNEWFIDSAARKPGYEDYYVWVDGKKGPNGENLPPNNWVSVFYGSAWTYHPIRQQYYLHQFTKEQPDLNFRNPNVVEEMKDVMRFWLQKGVSGFRVDAINHLFEDPDLTDEPKSGKDDDPLAWEHLDHIYTKDQPECYLMVREWGDLLQNWTAEHETETKVMMTEAYANLSATIKYYDSHSQIPFNFFLLSELNQDSTAPDFVFTINKWLTYMPMQYTANWVLGNHDRSRVGSRFGFERIDIMNMLLLTLPGIAISYNGEEIGMTDFTDILWEETKDPAALNTNAEVYKKYSRDPVRTPFQWDTEENAGFTDANSTWLPVNPNYRALNLKAQKEAELSHYKLYQQLVNLRKHETFLYGNFRVLAFSQGVFGYVRELAGSQTFVVVLNIGSNREIVNLDAFMTLPGELEVVATGIRSTYTAGSIIASNELRLGNYEALVLQTNDVFACNYSEANNSSPLSPPMP